ncbi:uncharacterized protein LOC127834387 [Dreissena polymorpha]|uniref:C2H2-type domain-containing protein n=1 Tax=Dreissena polymorpha TaxID=45954 RepID=A0A9D4G2L3_DREPO|nr:uncharacterized protein LOC127834387 [Dreissena polymorpha]KAH3807450.1 hypothetical protein DPMN_135791 [Dreissena polymorpha]
MSYPGQNRSGAGLPAFMGLLPPATLTPSPASPSPNPVVLPLQPGRVPFGGPPTSVNLPVGSQIHHGIPIPVMAVAPFQPDATSPPTSSRLQGKEPDIQLSLSNESSSISASSSTGVWSSTGLNSSHAHSPTGVWSPARVKSSHAVLQSSTQSSSVLNKHYSSSSIAFIVNSSSSVAKNSDTSASTSSLSSSRKDSLNSSESIMQNIETDTFESMHLHPAAEHLPYALAMNLRSNTNSTESPTNVSVRMGTKNTAGNINNGPSKGTLSSQKNASPLAAVVSEADLIKQAFTLKFQANPAKNVPETISKEPLSVLKTLEIPHDYNIVPNSIHSSKTLFEVKPSNVVERECNESAAIRQAFTLKKVMQSDPFMGQNSVVADVVLSASNGAQLPAFNVLLGKTEASPGVRNTDQSKNVQTMAIKDCHNGVQTLKPVHPFTSVIQSTSSVCNSVNNLTSKSVIKATTQNEANMQNGQCYLCSYSTLEYSDIAIWKHVLEKHVASKREKVVGTDFFCTHCYQPLQNFSEVKMHEAMYHLSDQQCFFCGLSLSNVCETDDTQAWKHVLNQHCVQYSCAKCDVKFLTKSGLEKHCKESGHFTLPNFQRHMLICPVCHMYFDHKNSLKQHLLNIHSFWKHSKTDLVSTQFECVSCSSTFLTEEALAFHKSVNSKDLNAAPDVGENDLIVFARINSSKNVTVIQPKPELIRASNVQEKKTPKTQVDLVKSISVPKSNQNQAIVPNVSHRHEEMMKISDTIFRNSTSKKNRDDRNFIEKAMFLDSGLDEMRLLTLGYDRKLSDRQLCQSLRQRPGNGNVEEYYSLCNLSYFCFVDCQSLPLPVFLSIMDAIYGHAVCDYKILKPSAKVIKPDEILVVALAVSRSDEFAKLLRDHDMPPLEMSAHVMRNLIWAMQFRNSLLSKQQLKMGPNVSLQQIEKDSDQQKLALKRLEEDRMPPSVQYQGSAKQTSAPSVHYQGSAKQTSAVKVDQVEIAKSPVETERVIAQAIECAVTEEVTKAQSDNSVGNQQSSSLTDNSGKNRRRKKQSNEPSSDKKNKKETKKKVKVVDKDFTQRKSSRQRKEKNYNEDVMLYYSDEDIIKVPYLRLKNTINKTTCQAKECAKDIDVLETSDKSVQSQRSLTADKSDIVESISELHAQIGDNNNLEKSLLEADVHNFTAADDEDTVPAIDPYFEERMMDVVDLMIPVLEKETGQPDNEVDDLNGLFEFNDFEPVKNTEKDCENTEIENVDKDFEEERVFGMLINEGENEDKTIPGKSLIAKNMLENNEIMKCSERFEIEKTDGTLLTTPKKQIRKSRKRKHSPENIQASVNKPPEPSVDTDIAMLEPLTVNTTHLHDNTGQHGILSPRSRIQTISPKTKSKMRNFNYEPWCIEMKKKLAVEALSAHSERIRKKLCNLDECSLAYFDDRIKCCYVKLLKIDGGLDEVDTLKDGAPVEVKKRKGRKRNHSGHSVEPVVQSKLSDTTQAAAKTGNDKHVEMVRSEAGTAVSVIDRLERETEVNVMERSEAAERLSQLSSDQPMIKKNTGRQTRQAKLKDVLDTSYHEDIVVGSTGGLLEAKPRTTQAAAKTGNDKHTEMVRSEAGTAVSGIDRLERETEVNVMERSEAAERISQLSSDQPMIKKNRGRQTRQAKLKDVLATSYCEDIVEGSTGGLLEAKPHTTQAAAKTGNDKHAEMLGSEAGTAVRVIDRLERETEVNVMERSEAAECISQLSSDQPMIKNNRGRKTRQAKLKDVLDTSYREDNVAGSTVGFLEAKSEGTVKKQSARQAAKKRLSDKTSLKSIQTAAVSPVSINKVENKSVDSGINISKDRNVTTTKPAVANIPPSVQNSGILDATLTTSVLTKPMLQTGLVANLNLMNTSASPQDISVITSSMIPQSILQQFSGLLNSLGESLLESASEKPPPPSLLTASISSMLVTPTLPPMPALIRPVALATRTETQPSQGHSAQVLQTSSDFIKKHVSVNQSVSNSQMITINPLMNIKKEKNDDSYVQSSSVGRVAPSIGSYGVHSEKPTTASQGTAPASGSSVTDPQSSGAMTEIIPARKPAPTKDSGVRINPLVNIKKEKYDQGYETSLQSSAKNSLIHTSTIATSVQNPSGSKPFPVSGQQESSLNKITPAENQSKPLLGPDQHVKINPLINIKKEKYDAGYGANQSRPGPRPPSLKPSSVPATQKASKSSGKILPPDQIVHINPLINIKKEKFDQAYEQNQTAHGLPRFVARYPSPMQVPGLILPPTPMTTSAAPVTSTPNKVTESDIMAEARKSIYEMLFGSGGKGKQCTPVTLTYSSPAIKTTQATALIPGQTSVSSKTVTSSDLNPLATKFPPTIPSLPLFPVSKGPTTAMPLYPTLLVQYLPTSFIPPFPPNLVPGVSPSLRSRIPAYQPTKPSNSSAVSKSEGDSRNQTVTVSTFNSALPAVSGTTSKRMFAPEDPVKINPLIKIKKEKFDAGYESAKPSVSTQPYTPSATLVSSTVPSAHSEISAVISKDQHVKINPLINIKREKHDPEYQSAQNKTATQSSNRRANTRTVTSTVSSSKTAAAQPSRGDNIKINPIINIKKEKHDLANSRAQHHQNIAQSAYGFPVQNTAPLRARFPAQVSAPRMSQAPGNQSQSKPGKILPPDQIVNINPLINIKKERVEQCHPYSSPHVPSGPQYGLNRKSSLADVLRQSTTAVSVQSGSSRQLPVSAHSSHPRQYPVANLSSSANRPPMSVNSFSHRHFPVSVHTGSASLLPPSTYSGSNRELPSSAHSDSPRLSQVSLHSSSPRQPTVPPSLSPRQQDQDGIMNNLLSILKDIHEEGRIQAAQQTNLAPPPSVQQLTPYLGPGPPAFNTSVPTGLIRSPLLYGNIGTPGYNQAGQRLPEQVTGGLSSFLVPQPITPPSAHQQKPQSFVVRNPVLNSLNMQNMSTTKSQGQPGVMAAASSNPGYGLAPPPYPIPGGSDSNRRQYGPYQTPPTSILPSLTKSIHICCLLR